MESRGCAAGLASSSDGVDGVFVSFVPALLLLPQIILPVRTGRATGHISRFDFSDEVTSTRCHAQQRSRDWLDRRRLSPGRAASACGVFTGEHAPVEQNNGMDSDRAQLAQLMGLCDEHPYQRLYALEAEPELI